MHVLVLVLAVLATLSLAAWLYLVFFHGLFWRMEPRLDPRRPASMPGDGRWPRVAAIVPARNESALLPETLPALLAQDYPGPFHVYVVDDRSADGTAEVALSAAREAGRADRLDVLQGDALPEGWKGKVWAMRQGGEAAATFSPKYLLLTDADTVHSPGMLRALVATAEAGRYQSVSAMTLLRVESFWDTLLIPAFVYFFAKLYPFRWAMDPRKRLAAANGGCILVDAGALERAGGFEAMAGAMIDDCAVARLVKQNGGRLWMGHTRDARSIRRHGDLSVTWGMVARYAFAQLGYSWLLLALTVLGMAALYLVPPAAVLAGIIAAFVAPALGAWWLLAVSLAAWALMSASYLPVLRWYGLPVVYAPLLPLSATLYTAMTAASGLRYWRGKGGAWKDRTYGATKREAARR